jgi:hypothetical protein
MSPRARRAWVAGAMLALVSVAALVFVMPFAFPTPPPIITGFNATLLFSPNGDGRRETATISVRVREPSDVTLEIRSPDDDVTLRRLLEDERRPRGWGAVVWDGRDDAGGVIADGDYSIRLRARAGRKQFNISRRISVDRSPPVIEQLEVESAVLAGPGKGECRVRAQPESDALMTAAARAGGRELASIGPRPVKGGDTLNWAWNGRTGGRRVPSGLVRIEVAAADLARNESRRVATCWVSGVVGRPVPASPRPGDRVGVVLTETDGTRLPADQPVGLALYRRVGTPGLSAGPVLGERIAGRATGPMSQTTVRLPRTPTPAGLWLVARTELGVALIPFRP